MTADELAALAVTCPHLAAKARNPLQVELATILGLLPPQQLHQILTQEPKQ
ncbi:hypothetical protein PP353_gp42 [Arthrobacter phage Kumotta]|uniref:Uncharacterized protein n=1 Tax=Arthrobacter phage Kumotta TaxID=2588498 RepID=A0A4Y6EM51_9CAUD|nr:hypothetical protein PP353_gp42 [Arthrobacter phage Kumotta]QDF19552.1 hypothetical protein SEA_KUMOTTA_42 [Arthrobacter phage Kumotta]